MVTTRSTSRKKDSDTHTTNGHTAHHNNNGTTKSAVTSASKSILSSINVTRAEAIDLIISVTAINVCYLIYAVLQERLTHHSSSTSVHLHMFIMLVQCVVNAALVLPIIIYQSSKSATTTPTTTLPPVPQHTSYTKQLQYACIGFTYVMGMLTSYWSFAYISYPTAVLVKSCKMVPVMMIGAIAFGKKYTVREVICVIGLTVGIYGFMYYSGNKHGDDGASSSVYGIALSGASLLCDGLTGSQQDKAVQQYKPSSYELMYQTNKYAVIELLVMTLFSGELQQGITLCTEQPGMLYDLIVFGSVSAFGQLFIFHMITTFGALPLAITTSTRKLLTILCSTIVFGHVISVKQWSCVGIVFASLMYDILGKASNREKKKAH